MKLRILVLAAIGVAVALLRGPSLAATTPDDVLKATLGNGLRVVIVRDTLAPVVSTDVAYLVGSRDDPADFSGMAHAQEHMMFRGTPNLNTSQLGTIATALGGKFNAETSDTLTQFEFTVPASNLDAVLRIESDRMRDILDAQSEWQNERGAIEQEVLRDDSAPGNDFFSDVQAIAFAGTPYARQGVGTVAAFNRLTGPDLKRFYDRWYAPNNAVLVIAGDVDKDAVLAQVRSYFDGVPKRPIGAHPVAHFEPIKRRTIRRPTSLTYPLAAVAFRFPGVDSPDFLASYMLQQVLSSERGTLRSLVDSGEALDAEWVSYPYFPGGSTRYRGRGARAEREPLVDDDAARGDPARLCAPRRPAGTVRDDEAPIDRQSGVRPQFDLLARERLGDDDRARRRTLDRARTGVARGRHAGRRQSRREPLPRSQSRDPRRADAVGEREPEPAARSGAERPGEAARRQGRRHVAARLGERADPARLGAARGDAAGSSKARERHERSS